MESRLFDDRNEFLGVRSFLFDGFCHVFFQRNERWNLPPQNNKKLRPVAERIYGMSPCKFSGVKFPQKSALMVSILLLEPVNALENGRLLDRHFAWETRWVNAQRALRTDGSYHYGLWYRKHDGNREPFSEGKNCSKLKAWTYLKG